MSTVGYGDVYPRTPTGQVVGTVVSFLSMIFLAMPLTIIVSSFSKTYKDSKKGLTNIFPGLIQVQFLLYFLVLLFLFILILWTVRWLLLGLCCLVCIFSGRARPTSDENNGI